MSIYKKIQDCRASIKASDLKKAGYNNYSNYPYYTPEQVDKLVYDVCLGNGLFNKFELKRDANGLYGQITVVDLDTEEEAVFIAATEMPVITATNASQQMGGCMTFAERYLKQTIYNIVDNNLDFDAHDNTGKKLPKKQPIQPSGNPDTQNPEKKVVWLNESMPAFLKARKAILAGTKTVKDIRKVYGVSTKMAELLEAPDKDGCYIAEPPPLNESGLPF